MRKLSKKISMLMVLAMLVGLFSGVVSASAASAWSFASSKYDVAVNGSINMESKEYADFDLLKDGKAPAGYTVAWASSDEDVVWVNAKTGQLRANKFGKAADGDKAVISATFTNTATKKSATRSFTIVLGAVKADFTVEAADVTIALGEEVKFAPVVKNADGKVVKFATHKSYNGYFLDGKAITNPWTPEEAGEYTVTVAQFAKKADVADLAKAVRKDEVTVTVTVDTAFDAKATGIKEITVYGDFAADAKFAVKKGAQNVTATATVAEGGKSAKLALANRLTKGTYTVSYGDAKADIAVEDEKVESIVIQEKGGQIFVDSSDKYAYVHYDVLNQYGESVRKSFDVKWTPSAKGGVVREDKNNGILVLCSFSTTAYDDDGDGAIDRFVYSDDSFDYNDTVVLTGVASGIGYAVSETATMTIGLERNASAAKVVGIVKDNDEELLKEIPASFNGGTYYLVFEMYDRAGYLMEFNNWTAMNDLTFTSLNPLLVKEFEFSEDEINNVYIDGVEYGKIKIVPGELDEQKKQGGVAEVRITSTKTGETSSYSLRVVSEQILDEFRVIQPDFIISETDAWGNASDVEIPFEAIDNTGAAITDFRALYKAVSFSSDSIQLREQNDGSAKLFYTVDRDDVDADKDYDYPVVFTAIVPGSGKSNSTTLYVKAARHAAYISKMVEQNGLSNYVLEGGELAFDLHANSWSGKALCLEINDQYDTKLENNGNFGNNAKSNYIAVKVIGSGLTVSATHTPDNGDTEDVDESIKNRMVNGYTICNTGVNDIKLVAGESVTESQQSVVVEFALCDQYGKIFSGSDKKFTFYVVDASKCVEFTVSATDGLLQNGYVNYSKPDENGVYGGEKATAKYPSVDYADFSVKGMLANGKAVAVPETCTELGTVKVVYSAVDYKYDSYALDADNWLKVDIDTKSDAATAANKLLFKDQSAYKAEGGHPDRKLSYTVTADIKVATASGSSIEYKLKDSAKTTVEIGDYNRRFVRINTKGYVSGNFNWTKDNVEACLKANNGTITYEDLISCIDHKTDNYDDTTYGNNGGITITITKLVDGGKGLATNDLKLVRNSIDDGDRIVLERNPNGSVKKSITPMIEEAEIGDTFVVTYTIEDAKHVITYTVGADQTAKFSDSNDNCPKR